MDRIFKRTALTYFFILSNMLFAGSQEESFLRANKMYKKQQYKQAVELYQSMPARGIAVWENIGNCFYALGDYAQALVAFKRAEHGTSSSQCWEIQQKINAVYRKLNYPIDDSWRQRWYTYIKCATSGISLLFLQLLLLLFWFSFSFYLYNSKRGKKYNITSVLLGCGLLFISIATTVKYKEYMPHIGIVLPKTVTLFTGPDENFHKVGTLNTAQQVAIQDERTGWYKIKHKKITGWVQANAIEKI